LNFEIVLEEVVGSMMVGSDMENFSINVEGHRAPRKRFGATSPRMKEFRGALQPLDGNSELLSPMYQNMHMSMVSEGDEGDELASSPASASGDASGRDSAGYSAPNPARLSGSVSDLGISLPRDISSPRPTRLPGFLVAGDDTINLYPGALRGFRPLTCEQANEDGAGNPPTQIPKSLTEETAGPHGPSSARTVLSGMSTARAFESDDEVNT